MCGDSQYLQYKTYRKTNTYRKICRIYCSLPRHYYSDPDQGSVLLVFSIGYQTLWGELLVEVTPDQVLYQMPLRFFLEESWTIKLNSNFIYTG